MKNQLKLCCVLFICDEPLLIAPSSQLLKERFTDVRSKRIMFSSEVAKALQASARAHCGQATKHLVDRDAFLFRFDGDENGVDILDELSGVEMRPGGMTYQRVMLRGVDIAQAIGMRAFFDRTMPEDRSPLGSMPGARSPFSLSGAVSSGDTHAGS